MRDLIQNELLRVVQEWHAGMPVRSIVLGHPEQHENFRQQRAHELVFALIEVGLENCPDFEFFDTVADEKARALQLNVDERAAAVSLAWAALRRGWARAVTGFSAAHAIELKREGEA